MDTTHQANAQQIAHWNGCAGRGWVEAQESLDRLFEPFEELLVEAVATGKATRVLDVGCGTGGTTIAAARQLGPKGTAVGIDVSQPMIALAKQRAELESVPSHFLCADAQTHAFDDKGFDLIEVSAEQAFGLGVNGISLGDERVISDTGATELNEALRARGITVVELDLSMFTLGGGGAHCLGQALRRERLE